MKREMNPKLKINDMIICYHMEGETSVPPGTVGTVKSIGQDPFEPGNDDIIIGVKWDNGSSLALVSSTDAWKLAPKQVN
jgi:hypothetical protein